ncbi:MAG: cytochrome c-type biogenesis protein [Hyphomicrobiaceae bacterium]
MRSTILIILLLLSVALPGAAHAVQPNEVLPDAALEARARDLSAHLRCLVCQNQSIDDSDAPLARDLRLLVRERLVAGDSDADVTRFLVARYGEFVLLRPPLGWHTLLLWLTPILLLTLAAGGIGWRLTRARGRGAGAAPVPLTADEQQRLAGLLKGTTSRN